MRRNYVFPYLVREQDFHRCGLIKVMSLIKLGMRWLEGFQLANAPIWSKRIFWPFSEESSEDFVHLFFRRKCSQGYRVPFDHWAHRKRGCRSRKPL